MRARWKTLPLWARALLLFAATRIVVLPAFVWAWTRQGPNNSFYTEAPPTFLEFLSLSWDAGWYRLIATEGYPEDLVYDPTTGGVQQSAWAFYPVFPFFARGVMVATTLPWEIAGPLTSMLAAAAAVVIVAYLVRAAAPLAVARRPGLPELAVVGLCAFPAAATMSVAYSESTALALIAASLLLVQRHRYWWALLPIVALGFARAAALPLAVVIVWHIAHRVFRHRRDEGPAIPVSQWLGAAAAFVTSVIAGFAWPLLVGVILGRADAYFQIQTAWRDGRPSSLPFLGFADKLADWTGPLAPFLLVVGILAIVVASFSAPARRLGPELQAWGGSYLLYLVAVGTLSSSLLRFSLLSITLPLALVAWSRRRWVQVLMTVILLAAQAAWIGRIWVFDGVGDTLPP